MSTARRYFVGAQPPLDARERLAEGVGRSLDPRVWRLVAAADLHLTVAFLGVVEDERLPALLDALRAHLVDFRPVDVVLDGAGTFERAGRAHVAWIGVRAEHGAAERLADLASRSFAAAVSARAIEAPRLGGPLVPHVTVARPRAGVALGALPAVFGPAERWTIDALQLFESRGNERPRYRGLERFPLRG